MLVVEIGNTKGKTVPLKTQVAQGAGKHPAQFITSQRCAVLLSNFVFIHCHVVDDIADSSAVKRV